jgi:hypothetical protein
MQVGTRIREVANPSNRVGDRRRKEVYSLPGPDHEVKGATARNGRAGLVENRTYAIPATIVGKSAVTRSRRGVITGDFANTMKYGDEGRTNVRGCVGVGLGVCLTRVSLFIVRFVSDINYSLRKNYRFSAGTTYLGEVVLGSRQRAKSP